MFGPKMMTLLVEEDALSTCAGAVSRDLIQYAKDPLRNQKRAGYGGP